ncbi:MAG: hypothetical protein H0V15_03695 [Solirubrobacterales bacterium]|nr:hypothetical protein [Solirubrobacterales bacterium]
MRGQTFTDDEARALLDARLGRDPQDALEATVVLEAWGGIQGSEVFELAASVVGRRDGNVPTSVYQRPHDEERRNTVADLLALLVAILSVAAWTVPLVHEVGASTVNRSLLFALPVAIAFQWILGSRYFSGGSPSEALGRHAGILVVALGTLAALPWVGVSLPWALSGVFASVWVAGTLLAHHRLGLLYAVVVALAAVALHLEIPPMLVLGVAAGFLVVAVFRTLVLSRGGIRGSLATPQLVPAAFMVGLAGGGIAFSVPWAVYAAVVLVVVAALVAVFADDPASQAGLVHRRTVVAGFLGGGIGVALVLDSSIGWAIDGSTPALALLPATVGSFWAGRRLLSLRMTLTAGLLGTSLATADAASWGNPAVLLFRGALARMGSATVVLSGLLVAGGRAVGFDTGPVTLLLALGLLSAAGLLVSLLEALGSTRWAVLCVAVVLGVEAAMRWLVSPPLFAGAGATVGGAVAATLAFVLLLLRLRTPGRLLATQLWIR